MFKLIVKNAKTTTTITVSRKTKTANLPDAVACTECGASIAHLSRCSLRPAR